MQALRGLRTVDSRAETRKRLDELRAIEMKGTKQVPPWLAAAIPMASPYCSCKLARVRSQEIQEKRNQALTTSSDVPAGSSLAWFPRSDFNGGCGSLKELYGR